MLFQKLMSVLFNKDKNKEMAVETFLKSEGVETTKGRIVAIARRCTRICREEGIHVRAEIYRHANGAVYPRNVYPKSVVRQAFHEQLATAQGL